MGLIGLTHQAARELAADRIRVNAVCPSSLPLAGGMPDVEGGYSPRVEKIVQAVVQLCSPAAGSITGQIIYIDEGQVSLAL
jgi:3-oxoacyl-[acyl-carrier protein] reductase